MRFACVSSHRCLISMPHPARFSRCASVDASSRLGDNLAAILLFSRSPFSGRLDALGALMIKRACLVLFLFLACGATKAQQPANDFAIVDGDRVLFYGDSITEQRLYTTD